MSEPVNENGLTFDAWMTAVDIRVTNLCGLSAHDLPDWHYWDSWDSGETPSEAAREILEYACEDMGMDSSDIFDF